MAQESEPPGDVINVHVAAGPYGIQVGKRNLKTHAPDKCAGQYCCIHNPSDHHMKTWPQNWRGDRYLMERICPAHGVGHPDPDDLSIQRKVPGAGVHGCCGCCLPGESE